MSGMTLVEFLRARLDEDEQVALAASPGPWRIDERSPNVILEAFPIDSVGMAGEHRHDIFTGQLSSRFGQAKLDAVHIARHDPARVLAEVAAKRRVVELHGLDLRVEAARFDRHTGWLLDEAYEVICVVCGWASSDPASGCETLRLLALPHAEHPDYREEWKP